MERLVFVLVATAKGKSSIKLTKDFFNPEKYGAHKSESRPYPCPLWTTSCEPARSFSQ